MFSACCMAAGLLGGCGEPPRSRPDPFTATGELVALSGGDAGARRACITCHGLSGEGDGQAAPRLAGLPVGYLQKQLEDYAAGLRDDEAMRPITKALDDQDRRAVAEYYAALPVRAQMQASSTRVSAEAADLYHRGDPTRSLAACAVCHGAAGEGIGPANPPLAGQPPAYLAEQLRLWREGRRRNDPLGQMGDISRRLTPSEAAALGEYAASLGP